VEELDLSNPGGNQGYGSSQAVPTVQVWDYDELVTDPRLASRYAELKGRGQALDELTNQNKSAGFDTAPWDSASQHLFDQAQAAVQQYRQDYAQYEAALSASDQLLPSAHQDRANGRPMDWYAQHSYEILETFRLHLDSYENYLHSATEYQTHLSSKIAELRSQDGAGVPQSYGAPAQQPQTHTTLPSFAEGFAVPQSYGAQVQGLQPPAGGGSDSRTPGPSRSAGSSRHGSSSQDRPAVRRRRG
jgi:hypothetical protein